MKNQTKNQWKTSIACPLCQGKIGIVSGVMAPTPFALFCPHCRKWLRVQLPGLLYYVIAACLLIAMWTIGGYMLVSSFGLFRLFLVASIGILLVADISTCLLFFTYAKFAPFKNNNRLKQ